MAKKEKEYSSPRQFFNTLDLSQLDAESADYIRTELLPDARLDLLPESTQEYTMVVDLINESYPKASGSADNTDIKPEEKAEEVIVAEEVVTAPIPAEKPTKEQLIQRLKLVKKMLAKNPSDKNLNGRVTLIEKMIAKA